VSNASIRPMEGKTIIFVSDTLKALQDMARSRRMGKEVTIIGITGTNGKTTTKEMIASVLNVNHKAAKNSGNFNNHIGLPLSLLEMEEEEFGVFEMGASMKGDIQELCEIALPDIGVVTNIGMGHLASFGSIEVVRSTKLELLSSVRIALVNADDLFLMEGVLDATMRSRIPRIVTFGIEKEADVIAKDISSEYRRSHFTISFGDGRSIRIVMNVPGKFNISNTLAAAAVADIIGIATEDIRRGIEAFHGIPMRLEFKEFLGATVICDAYNANPASMDGALNELVRMKKTRAVAVLGDMLELGHYAEDAHRRLGRTMAGLHVDLFIAVGPLMSKAAEEFSSAGGRTIMARDAYEAGEILRNSCAAGDVILLKGSRGTGMERVLEMTQQESVVQSRGGG